VNLRKRIQSLAMGSLLALAVISVPVVQVHAMPRGDTGPRTCSAGVFGVRGTYGNGALYIDNGPDGSIVYQCLNGAWRYICDVDAPFC
jgi:hypothetical protein